MKIGYDVPRHLSCVSLTFNEGKLFCFGGNTGVRSKKIVDQFEKNNDLLIMDLESSSFETDVTPEILKKRMAVHGATSHWVDSETLLISGGSEAPLGVGGRSIFVYTSKNIIMSECSAGVACVWECNRNLDGTMIICDGCEQSIHKYCDKTVRNLDNENLPDKYFCPTCRKRRQANKRG